MSYPASVTTLEEAVAVAERMLARRSKEMVSDGIILARWIKQLHAKQGPAPFRDLIRAHSAAEAVTAGDAMTALEEE
jgi:hypothetical protein